MKPVGLQLTADLTMSQAKIICRLFSISSIPSTKNAQQALLEAELNRLARMRYRRRNLLVGFGLLAGVLGIYGYSMFAVQQESLDLDELDKPVEQGNR